MTGKRQQPWLIFFQKAPVNWKCKYIYFTWLKKIDSQTHIKSQRSEMQEAPSLNTGWDTDSYVLLFDVVLKILAEEIRQKKYKRGEKTRIILEYDYLLRKTRKRNTKLSEVFHKVASYKMITEKLVSFPFANNVLENMIFFKRWWISYARLYDKLTQNFSGFETKKVGICCTLKTFLHFLSIQPFF